MTESDIPYENLANAIIIQAVKDFRKCIKVVKCNGRNKEQAIKEMREIVGFIKSPWFRVLTNLDPQVLLKKLQEEVNE
mgnify:CR=1 FL=1